MIQYTQCLLRRGNEYMYTWLPQKYARKGKVLSLNDKDGYIVAETYATVDEDWIKAYSHFYDHWALIRGLKKRPDVIIDDV